MEDFEPKALVNYLICTDSNENMHWSTDMCLLVLVDLGFTLEG